MKKGIIQQIPRLYHNLSLYDISAIIIHKGGCTCIHVFRLIRGLISIAYNTGYMRCLQIIIRGFLGFIETHILVIDTHPTINSFILSEYWRTIR